MTVKADSYTDLAGNQGGGGTTPKVDIDTLLPSVVITGPTGAVVGPFTITITFPEQVEDFTLEDIIIGGGTGTLSEFQETSTGTVWTVLVTPVLGKIVTINIPADVATDLAGNGNTAAKEYSVQAGSPEYEFDKRREQVRNVVREQAVKKLTTSVRASHRMMMDVRDRMISATRQGQHGAAGGSDAVGYMPLGFNGNVDGSSGPDGMITAKGDFFGQTGFNDGVNYRLFGNFDVLSDNQTGLMSAIDTRLLREQMVSPNLMLGAYVGADYSNGQIENSFEFNGDQDNWTVFGGGYFIAQVGESFYFDGFASLGYGESDLTMNTDLQNGYFLDLDSNYSTLTWQVGGSMTGVFAVNNVEFRPNLTVIYGNTELGQIGFTARAYGLTDQVSLDAGAVELGTLRFTPELRFGLDGLAPAPGSSALSLLPSFVCEQVVGSDTRTECGGGLGLGFTGSFNDDASIFSINVDYEQIGGIDRVGGHAEFTHRF